MVGHKCLMVGHKCLMVGHKLLMIGHRPAQAHPWLRHCKHLQLVQPFRCGRSNLIFYEVRSRPFVQYFQRKQVQEVSNGTLSHVSRVSHGASKLQNHNFCKRFKAITLRRAQRIGPRSFHALTRATEYPRNKPFELKRELRWVLSSSMHAQYLSWSSTWIEYDWVWDS